MSHIDIDWKLVWKEFEVWFNKMPRTWASQKRKIRELVEKYSTIL
jgi:hypothetical protein